MSGNSAYGWEMRLSLKHLFTTAAAAVVLSAMLLTSCSSDSPSETTAIETRADTSAVETAASGTASGSAAAETVAGPTAVVDPTTAPAAGPDQEAGKAPFVLNGNGVDDVKFGDDLNAVKETFVAKHGEPDQDSGWNDQQSPCEGLGTKVRSLVWGDLSLEFSNGPTEYGPANSEHLIAYFSADDVNGSGVVAPDGQPLIDQTIAQLKARFPKATFTMNEIAGPEYRLPGDILGSVSGLADTDTVQTFRAGLICID